MAKKLIYEKVGAIAQMTEKEKNKFDVAFKKFNRKRKAEGLPKVVMTEMLRQLILKITKKPQTVLDFFNEDDNN